MKERQKFSCGGWVDTQIPEQEIKSLLQDDMNDLDAFMGWLAANVGTYRMMRDGRKQDPSRKEMLSILRDFQYCLEGVLHYTSHGGLPSVLQAHVDANLFKYNNTMLRAFWQDPDQRLLVLLHFVREAENDVRNWKQPRGVKSDYWKKKLYLETVQQIAQNSGADLVIAGKFAARILEMCGVPGLASEERTVKRVVGTQLRKKTP